MAASTNAAAAAAPHPSGAYSLAILRGALSPLSPPMDAEL
jgi:hypothetical protein